MVFSMRPLLRLTCPNSSGTDSPLVLAFARVAAEVGLVPFVHAVDGVPDEAMWRVQQVARWHDFYVGMIKAPVFAFLIAMVGCMHGMKVSGSAESVGHETTAAVVQAIFLVLVADALFSVMFDKMGI